MMVGINIYLIYKIKYQKILIEDLNTYNVFINILL